jgi:hypothetical protein
MAPELKNHASGMNFPGEIKRCDCLGARMHMNWRMFAKIFGAWTGVVLAMLLLLVSCQTSYKWAHEVDWPDLDRERLPQPAEYPDFGAVILLDEGSLDIIGREQVSSTVFRRHRIVKIFNAGGYRFTNVAIPFNSSSQVENIRARTISPDGRITIVKPENIYTATLYPEFIFYADQQARIFTFPAVEPGCIIEYEYDLRIGNHTLVHNWTFQNDAPALRSRFRMHVPSEWELKYRVYNGLIEPAFIKTPGGFKSSYVWELHDVPALIPEFGMPPFNEVELRLSFSPMGFKNWTDVADWYRELSDPQNKTDAHVDELVRELTKDLTDDHKKIQVLFEWVRDHIRYIAVAIGMGSFQPHAAEETLLNRYGDCKDMTTLLCAMGRRAGIPMQTALVSTRPNGPVDTSLASPFQFNHAIACCELDSAIYWLDATQKGCPFGAIPWYNQNAFALVVGDPGKGELRKISGNDSGNNITRTDWQLAIDAEAGASAQGQSRFSGDLAAELREYFQYTNQAGTEEWMRQFIGNKCPSARLDTFTIEGLQPVTDPLLLRYSFRINDLFLKQGEKLYLAPAQLFEMSLLRYFNSPKRSFALVFNHEFTNRFDIDVRLPQGWRVLSPAQSDSVQTDLGKAKWTFTPQESGFKLSMKFSIFSDRVPVEAYKEFREFLDKVHGMDLRLIGVCKN